MPTVISHSIVGLAAASVFPAKSHLLRFWLLSAICPVIPDADSITFKLGIPYSYFFGHRGFFHSLFFALIVGIFVATVFFRDEPPFTKDWVLLCGYFFLITATHGILDALTSGGLGIALLSPFDNTRYFFPWSPIKVSPIDVRSFFSAWGMRVILNELVWIWIPSAVIFIVGRILFHGKAFLH